VAIAFGLKEDRFAMTSDADSARAYDFLAACSANASPDAAPQIITTHAAWVFLVGDRALKIKRPVDLGFLDFSTRAARQRACNREVELNRRFTPDLYLGLQCLVEAENGTLALVDADTGQDHHGGRPIEYVVAMRRFDNDALLSRRIATGDVSEDLLRDLAGTVHAMHDAAPAAMDDRLVSRLGGVIDDISDALSSAPFLASDIADKFRTAARETFARLQPRLRDRLARGLVRRCHGDLHCENLVILDGRVVPFDALEFDETLGTVDIFYDLGFLLMDLCVRGGAAPANTVLNAYLDASGDPIALRDLDALRFFMGLRAGVRAMVAVHKSRSDTHDAAEASRRAAETYAGFANAMLCRTEPVMIAIGGGSGTGKSTVARALAPQIGQAPGAVHLRSDAIRKQLAGVAFDTRLPASSYTPEASARVYRAMQARAELALAAGHAVIVDVVFGKHSEQGAAAAIATRRGARFFGVWLELDAETQRTRVAERRGDVSDATPDILEAQRAKLEPPPPGDWTRLDASAPAQASAKQIAKLLQT
jgi:aminoglycoside phosphotransferase family enzyme/predicted kinase